jgi:hypothetical protein
MLDPPLRVVPHTRPLYFQGTRLYCARFNRVLATEDYGRTFTEVGVLDLEIPARGLVAASWIAQRVVRASIYRMRVLPDGGRVYVFKGGVYRQAPGETTASRTYTVERGSRPVSLAVSDDGFVVFGEYWTNNSREPVRVFGSSDGGASWCEVHRFERGAIRHVHGISFDPWEKKFWISAGDEGDENRLMRASVDFSEIEIVRKGGQQNRFYSTLVLEHHLVTATDTPSEKNHICMVDKRTGELTRVAAIENTSFYNCVVGGAVFVSTNAEPSDVNDVNASHVWLGRPDRGEWRRVGSFPVDFLDRVSRVPGIPRGLFQIPRMFFPEGDNPGTVLACHALGVGPHSDAMLCFDASAWCH